MTGLHPKEPNRHIHKEVNAECERVWAGGGSIRLAASFSRLTCLLREVSGIEAWHDGLEAKAIAHRKSLRPNIVLIAFSCTGLGKGHWHVEQLARKITVDESSLAFLGQEFSQPRVVLELASTKRVFVEWVHQTLEVRVAVDRKRSVLIISDRFPADPMVADREALAVSARHAAKFLSSGFQDP